MTMNALTILPAADVATLAQEEVDATLAFARAEKAIATRAAYAADWVRFQAWCGMKGPRAASLTARALAGGFPARRDRGLMARLRDWRRRRQP
jgi:hypothetical protein